jgi:hypothetical protein
MTLTTPPTSASFEEAKYLLGELKRADAGGKLSAKCPSFPCVIGWLEEQQRKLDIWRFDPLFGSTRKLWDAQVAIHLELLLCFAARVPIPRVPPTDPKRLAAAAARKDEDEEGAAVMAGMVIELRLAFDRPDEVSQPSADLKVVLDGGSSSSTVQFHILLQRAVDTNNPRLLKWLIDREHKIVYVTNGEINPTLWARAKKLYAALTQPPNPSQSTTEIS